MEKVKLTKKEQKLWEEMQAEEVQIEKDLENGLYRVVENQEEEKERLKQIFEANRTKRKAVSIKPLEADILKIKAKALAKGIPYQTLIASIIHQFANDKLVES